MSRINVMLPYLGAEEIAALSEVISSGWVAQGPKVAAFESAFAAHQQAEHAVAVSSCTTALHLALVVAGVQAGDDVVVPSFSFIATANAATYVGARPVFADVDRTTGNLTAETVAAALTPQTTAIATETTPTDSDARAPQMMRLRMSRPRSSVPRRCARLGSAKMARTSCVFGS